VVAAIVQQENPLRFHRSQTENPDVTVRLELLTAIAKPSLLATTNGTNGSAFTKSSSSRLRPSISLRNHTADRNRAASDPAQREIHGHQKQNDGLFMTDVPRQGPENAEQFPPHPVHVVNPV
jgi:hypothetical protein